VEKSAYYTPDSIDRVAAAMLDEVAELRDRHPIAIDPTRAALIILDLQRYFADPASHAFVPSLPAIVPRIGAIARAFIAVERPVILTRHIDESDLDSPMRSWWHDAIDPDDQRSELIESIRTTGAPVLSKRHYDAFLETDLDERLRASNAAQVVVCGIHAHLCCETTARSAFMRGYDVFFAVDGTATYNAAFHRASLLNLAHGFAVPVLCREVLATLEKE